VGTTRGITCLVLDKLCLKAASVKPPLDNYQVTVLGVTFILYDEHSKMWRGDKAAWRLTATYLPISSNVGRRGRRCVWRIQRHLSQHYTSAA